MALACRRVFSGIQPTGVPHLGNYFGAIARWIRLTNERRLRLEGTERQCDTPIFSIVDVHAYSAANVTIGQALYRNILATTASLIALGLDPNKCILFRQSDLYEHNYLDNVLDNFVSPNRLTRMTQFKEKSDSSKTITNGLLNYPVLQAADILLYRADVVPVGEDQVQHIELTRDIAKKFNAVTGSNLFPEPTAYLEETMFARRVKSLRNPKKKMSKSDADLKSFIEVIDEPEVIVEKCKKALTDCISRVYYDETERPGVSNLVRIYHLTTNNSISRIEEIFAGVETAKFKLHLADVLIDKFAETRQEYKRLVQDPGYLEKVLELGANKARPLAEATLVKVKELMGSQPVASI